MAVEKKLNKKLYQEWYQSMRQWNEAELIDRIHNAGKLTPQQGWEQYQGLAHFALNYCPEPGEWQQQQKMKDLAHYYERIRKLEAWRQKHGKST